MFISSEAIVNATSAVVRASLHRRADEEEEEVNCGEGGGDDAYLGLRIASVFIILVGSTFGALFPVLAKRAKWLTIPKSVFEYAPVVIVLPYNRAKFAPSSAASQSTLDRVSSCVCLLSLFSGEPD